MSSGNPTNKGALAGNHYRFGGNYAPGTAPTLLSSVEARKVVGFIENIVYNSITFLRTGSPNRNGFWLDLTDPKRVEFWLQIQTDLFFDKAPKLGADLLLNGFNIVADSAYSYFRQHSDKGLQVISGPTYTGAIRLGTDPVYTFQKFIGFQAPSQASADVVWTLPSADGTANQFLKTNGSKVLSWATSSSSVTVNPSATINVVNVGDAYTPHLMGLEAETLVGRKGQYLRVRNDESGFEFVSCPLCVMGACCVEGVCEQTVEIDCVDTWLEGVDCTPSLCTEGTCCVGETCTFTIEANCSGTWSSGGSCTPNPCALGACCAADGACTVTTAAACTGTWSSGGNCTPSPCHGACAYCTDCTEMPEYGCTAGVFFGAGSTCAGTYPNGLGLCCKPDGTSVVIEPSTCLANGWTWTDCPSLPLEERQTCCGALCGACCMPAETCAMDSLINCNNAGGLFLDPMVYDDCTYCTFTGSCCAPDNFCDVTTQAECPPGWTWTHGADCAPNPCGPFTPTGACCNSDGDCHSTQEASCLAPSVFTVGTACGFNTCSAIGSCCAENGTCAETIMFNCTSPSIWTEGGNCSPNPCITGSCCNGLDCTVTTQANCAYTWTQGGVCSPNPCMGVCCEYMGSMAGSGGLNYPYCSNALTQETCEAEGNVWHADGVIADCPDCPILGACCAAGQSGGPCTEVTEAACNIIGGHWTLGVHCGPGSQECDDWGACCHNDPYSNASAPLVCEVTNTGSCSGLLGTYHPFQICDTVNCANDLGTCCSPSYVCTDVLASHCFGVGYVWTGGQNCAQNPCVVPTGSCCNPDGSCTVTTAANCIYTWSSGGVCSPNTCEQPPATGSCCAPDGTCSVTTQANCTGTWTSGGVCSPNTCTQPTGACCGGGGCNDTTEANCNYNEWYSTPCAQSPCFGSCCNGVVCTNVQAANCGGVFTPFENCTQFSCTQPPTGSCCAADGTCSVTTQANCTGTWSSGGNCSPNICAQPPTGSCCVPFTGCQIATESSCTIQGGTWTSGGSCTPDPCGGGATGACCFFGGAPCQVLSSGDCMIFGGMYQGDGTTCAGAGC